MSKPLQKIRRTFLNLIKMDYVKYKNLILPPQGNRLCGGEFQSDEYFIQAAQRDASRLVDHCGLTKASHLLDIGCGPGRLPIGILSHVGEIAAYRGVDVDSKSVQWCQEHISVQHPSFQFIRVDVKNERYNPAGEETAAEFRFPFPDGEFNIIYLYSVFSHMVTEDIRSYLKEFERLLAPHGKIFLTAFIEDGVPDISINPENYRMDWKNTPLHCVRYDRAFFNSLLDDCGLFISRFDYGSDTDGQSAVFIARKNE